MSNCYAQCLGNCSGKISREHYISRSLLELSLDADNKVMVDGLLSKDGLKLSTLNTAVAKVLCETHNNFLSEYDSSFSALVKELMEFNQESTDKILEVSGEEITLWLVKAFLGRVAAENNQENIYQGSNQFDYMVNVLFQKLHFNESLGFTLAVEDPPAETHREGGFPPWATSIQKSNGIIVGFKAWVYPFSFVFLLPGIGGGELRPSGCLFNVTGPDPRKLEFRITW